MNSSVSVHRVTKITIHQPVTGTNSSGAYAWQAFTLHGEDGKVEVTGFKHDGTPVEIVWEGK